MADQCRSLALSRNTDELRNIFLQMARRYDAEAIKGEQELTTNFAQGAEVAA